MTPSASSTTSRVPRGSNSLPAQLTSGQITQVDAQIAQLRRSDHYNYARYGIPVVYVTTGHHPDYHQLADEPQYVDYKHMARVVSLVSDIAVHIANLDHRLVVDHPKLDPHGSCRQ